MEDVSKTTIAVLLILVVLISVIGTWAFLNSITGIQQAPLPEVTESQGKGNLRLIALNPFQPATSTNSQANVKLTVLRHGEGG